MQCTEGAAHRTRERNETIAQTRQLQGAAAAEKMRMQLEGVETEVPRTACERTTARCGNASLLRKERAPVQGADLRATLAAMTPAERRMPTVVNNGLTTGPMVAGYRVTTDETPPAQRVLSPDYDVWRARRSPVQIRSSRATFVLSGTCQHPAVQRAVREAFGHMEWVAIRSTLEVPR